MISKVILSVPEQGAAIGASKGNVLQVFNSENFAVSQMMRGEKPVDYK